MKFKFPKLMYYALFHVHILQHCDLPSHVESMYSAETYMLRIHPYKFLKCFESTATIESKKVKTASEVT